MLAFGIGALVAVAAGWLLWVTFLLAPEPGDSIYRWAVAVVILMLVLTLGLPFFMHYVGSTQPQKTPKKKPEGVSRSSIAIELASGGLLLAAFALVLWGFFVIDADISTSAPIYVWALLLVLLVIALRTIPWISKNPRCAVVGAFLLMYTIIVFALAVHALDGSQDWRFWTLLVVLLGLWVSLAQPGGRSLVSVKDVIEIALVISVFVSVITLLCLLAIVLLFDPQFGIVETLLAAPLNFLVEVGFPIAAMAAGFEIAEKLDRWLGPDWPPRWIRHP